MDDEYAVKFQKIMDESDYTPLGDTVRVKMYRFFIGRHGPFTEKVPLEPFDANEITRRVDALTMHLRALPR